MQNYYPKNIEGKLSNSKMKYFQILSNQYSFAIFFLGMKKKSMKSSGEDSGAG